MNLNENKNLKKCRICLHVGDKKLDFIKKANLCKKCSLKRFDKISYKNCPEMREKIKAKAREYYKNLSPEKKKAKSKRVMELVKLRKFKKEAEQQQQQLTK